MLATLLGAPLTLGVDSALAAAPAGTIAVLGDAGLARRLGGRGRETVLVSLAGDKQGAGVVGTPTSLPFDGGELAALVGPRLAAQDDWEVVLVEWRRVVQPGGLIVLVDRGEPSEPARRALCGGLTDVRQRTAGRTVVTTGRVVHL